MILKYRANIILVVLSAFLFNLYVHRRELLNFYVVYPDVSYFLYGLFDSSISDNSNFMQIRAGTFLTFPSLTLAHMLWIINNLSKLIPLPLIATSLSIIYSLVSTIIVFKIGSKISSRGQAFILTILFLAYTSTMDTFFGGQCRGVGLIITCLVYYFLLKDRWKISEIVLCLSLTVIYYSAILPMIGLAVILSFFNRIDRKAKIKLVFLISALLLISSLYIFYNNILGNLMYWKSNLNIEGDAGKDLLGSIKNFLLNFIFNINEHSIIYKYYAFTLLALNILILAVKRKKYALEPNEIKFIFAAFLSFLMLMPINAGIASRQLIFSIPLILLVSFWRQLTGSPSGKRMLASAAIIFLAIFFIFNKHAHDLEDLTKYKKAYEYVSLLPQGSLIAGHPESIKFVPFFSKKSIFYKRDWLSKAGFLYSQETKHALDLRREDLVRALYSSDYSAVGVFLEQYDISQFIIEDYYYSPDYLSTGVEWYESPEKDLILNYALKENRRAGGNFLFLDLAHRYGKYFGNGIYILNREEIIKAVQTNLQV